VHPRENPGYAYVLSAADQLRMETARH